MRFNPLLKIIRDCDRLERVSDIIHRDNKKLVLVNGTFDLIHPGHINLLNKSAEYGDVLITLINSDYSVRVLKGENRPIYKEDDRCKFIASIIYVDYVYVFNTTTITSYLSIIKPDVWVKGSDYIGHVEQTELDEAKRLNIQIEYVDRGECDYSSSELYNTFSSHLFI